MQWRLLKQFPTLPPFGSDWFGILQEPNHPLAVLRTTWTLLNMQQDHKEEQEQRKSEIEYFGLFAGPDVYRQVKALERGETIEDYESGGVMGESFKIIRDTSAFTERFNRALSGEVVLHDPRPDIAAWVSRKREEKLAQEEGRQVDRRIHTPPTSEPVYDELIIERKPKDPAGGQ